MRVNHKDTKDTKKDIKTRIGRLRPVLFVSFVSLWFHHPLPVRADMVLRANGESLFGRVRLGEAPGILVLDRPGLPRAPLDLAEIVAVDFGREIEPEPIRVTLHSGERLAGKVSLAPPDRVTVARAGGTVGVPLAACATVILANGDAGPGGAGGANVLLTNGDRVTGSVIGIREGRLLLKTSVGQLPIDLKRVAALRLPRKAAEPPSPAGEGAPRVLLELITGERIIGQVPTGGGPSGERGALPIRTAWGARLGVPLESISRLTIQNGRFQFLSDLRPAEARHTPYLDTPRPHRVNESVSGGPLRLGGDRFSRGLGVHARSDLTYELASGYKTFAAVIGVDAAVGGAGSVLFRVLGDDRVLYESPVLRGGDAPLPIRVDVHGVLLLRLVVDFADNGDLADHANWANAHLLR